VRLGGNAQSVGRRAVEAAKVAAGGGGDERERRQHEGDHTTKGAFGILFIFSKRRNVFLGQKEEMFLVVGVIISHL
jgi:hypothetical protein